MTDQTEHEKDIINKKNDFVVEHSIEVSFVASSNNFTSYNILIITFDGASLNRQTDIHVECAGYIKNNKM